MRAVFLDAETFGKNWDFKLLSELDLEWRFYERTAPKETIERMQGAEIAVTNKVVFDHEVINSLPHLKLISVVATGVNCVDLAAAAAEKIAVCNVPGYSQATVTQMTILMILSLAASFVPYVEDVKKGKWQRSPLFCFLDHPIVEVKGKKLGILGFGNLGREVARIMTAFGMEILVVERSGSNLDEILKTCDFLTVHTPLTPSTRNLIGKKELEMMKRSAFVINVSRGGIVNEEALAEALRGRKIAGAALDVLTAEPPPPNHPLLDPSIPNLLLTPHIAWASSEARQTIIEVTRKNIEAFLAGEPQNRVYTDPRK